ncbi:PLP-dependent aminotransferase family protein [Streptomyces sp. NPDC059740]|uniref:aminotransferase-like domain-containing protein n=1 Tax=Streptomyces sp. NPDC059740 TaxID=3346926 RepID=UPI003647CA14
MTATADLTPSTSPSPASPSPSAPAPVRATTAPPPALAARVRSTGSSPVRDILALTARPEVVSFAGGLPAPELFDSAGLAAAFAHALREEPRRALQYSPTDGDPLLRETLAGRLSGRGLPTSGDDLLVTTGSQQGLSLLATALLEPGDVVLVEEPCYLAALQVFSLAGARAVPVPGDADGLDPAALEEIVVREQPRLLYLVPSFQNPTGRTLPADRRAAVAEVAARHGLWVVEDDPYGELRFEGEPVPWISCYPGAEDRTVLLGSLSKTVAPGLRLGWLRAPGGLRRACVLAKQAADLHTSTVDQAAAARYLQVADLAGHLKRVREAYRERRDALVDGLGEALPEGSRWNRPEGGMFVWATLPAGFDTTAALPTVVRRDVAYVPGAPFFCGPPDVTSMRLSFVTHAPEEIREGLRRLGRGLAAVGG